MTTRLDELLVNEIVTARSFVGKDNIGGTGNAANFPSGIYNSAGTMWLYGNIIGNGSSLTNLGSITPLSNNTYSLGSSSLVWNQTYTAGLTIGSLTLTESTHRTGLLQIQDSASIYAGIMISNASDSQLWSLMADESSCGLYNDTDNQFYFQCVSSGAINLYHSGSSKLATTSTGVSITGTVTATTFSGNATSASNVTGGTLSGNLISNNYGIGLVGLYSATRYQNVFAMGAAYDLPADGLSTTGFYGIAWTHTNIGGQSKAGLSHQALFMTNGVTQTAIGTGIWTTGSISAGGTVAGTNITSGGNVTGSSASCTGNAATASAADLIDVNNYTSTTNMRILGSHQTGANSNVYSNSAMYLNCDTGIINATGFDATGDIKATSLGYRANVEYNWATLPRAGQPANSIKVYDVYNDRASGPTGSYGSLMSIYGRSAHLEFQFFMGNADDVFVRNAFYLENTYSPWQRLFSDSYHPNADTWTTGRTLTIGSTGKSVNGSADVSWSLAEIGAQAAGSYAALNGSLAQNFSAATFFSGSGVSDPGSFVNNDTSTTGYTCTWKGAATRDFHFECSASTGNYSTRFTNLGSGFHNVYCDTFVGALQGSVSGNVSGNVTGSSGSCTGNSATVTNGVYTNTTQTISGSKTFSGGLHVPNSVDLTFDASAGPALSFRITSGTGSSGLWLRNDASATNEFYWDNNGNFSADNNITAYSSTTNSDRKLKKNIKTVENALDKICQLRGVFFDWKRDDVQSAGVIAQEIEEILPRAVMDVKDLNGDGTHKVVNYDQLHALHIEAMKDLKAENDSLKQEIAEIKEMLNGLTSNPG